MNTRKRPVAGCHPDRPHLAKGLCKSCYDLQYQKANPEATNARKRSWARKNPERVRAIKRKYLYGIDPETIQARLNAQSGLCKICLVAPALHLDHNHSTGQTRSLLCGDCNRAIGLLREDIARIRRAAAYLELWDDRAVRVKMNTGQPCCGG
jgi:hypothetical protein